MKANRLSSKRILSLLLALVMIAGMLPMNLTAVAAATPEAYDGVPVTPTKITSSNYAQLGLTEDNWEEYDGFYAIRNAKELYGFANLVNDMDGWCSKTSAVLLQDIVVNETVSASGAEYSWTPIGLATVNSAGYGAPYYTGTFDGNGHTISGLYCNRTDAYSGLFAATGYSRETVIKNVILKNSYIYGTDYVGGIVGYAFWNNTTISNCKVSSSVTVQGSGKFVGGIIGGSAMLDSVDRENGSFNKDNQVVNCVNFGTVKTTASTNAVGGIAGAWAKETDYQNRLITVTNSYYLENCASNSAGTVSWACGTYNERSDNWADSTGCTALSSADAEHTCVSVEHKEILPVCGYPGHTEYSDCLICGEITSGTKNITPGSDSDHHYSGGTCVNHAVCEWCGATGEKDADNHISTQYTYEASTTDSAKHNICYKCCGALVGTEAHKFSGGNCVTAEKCNLCGAAGKKHSENHTSIEYTYKTNAEDSTKHDIFHKCCGVFVETASHKFAGGDCVTAEACEFCSGAGNKYPDVHASSEYTYTPSEADDSKHDVFHKCCGVLKETLPHEFVNAVCSACKFRCNHPVIENGKCVNCGDTEIVYLYREWNGTKVVEELRKTDGFPVDITTSTTSISDGWYMARGTINTGAITVSGTSHLILLDGASLTVNSITLSSGATLYIYSQSDITGNIGQLNAKGGIDNTNGAVIINGGRITATGSNASAGIGGKKNESGGNLTINGGIVTATGGTSGSCAGAGIGGGYNASSGVITINGGTVTAYGRGAKEGSTNSTSTGIGSGGRRNSDTNKTGGGTIIINGGNVKAVPGSIPGVTNVPPVPAIGNRNSKEPITLTDGNGNNVYLNTITLDSVPLNNKVTSVAGMGDYGLTDLCAIDGNKLYFYLPSSNNPTGVTMGNTPYEGTLSGSTTKSGTFYHTHEYENRMCIHCGKLLTDENGDYLIYTAEELIAFATSVNGGNTSAKAKLMADIDLAGYDWKPIGTYSDSASTADYPYTGTFDGNYHIIKNLSVKVETAHETGLFGRINGGGTVKNLGVVNATVENTQGIRAGVIAGEIHNSTVTNVYTAGNITVTTSNAQAGGIAGECASSTLTNCYTTYGNLTSNAGTVTNCYYMAEGANTASKGTNLPESAFTSGELACTLNDKIPEGIWKQNLGENGDAYPGFVGGNVYPYADTCDITTPTGYSNSQSDAKAHTYGDDGVCDVCDAFEPAVLNNGIYEINNVGQYMWFAQFVNGSNVNANGKLMDDIDLTAYAEKFGNVMIGTSTNKYSGNFDGNEKKLTVSLDGATDVAPFGYVDGATIHDLTVDGTIKASGKFAAGIVSHVYGNTTIEKCISKVTIESTVSGDGTHGGLVAITEDSSVLTVDNCGFIGAINGSSTTHCAGLVGYSRPNNVNNVIIKNSYVAATFTASTSNANTFARQNHTLINCYYLNAFGDVNSTGATQKNKAAFESGEVAYLLNGGNSEGAWGQLINTDTYPVLGGDKVYLVCAETGVTYTNDASKASDHSYGDDGICDACDALQPAKLNNGIYEISNVGQYMWFANFVNAGNTDADGKLMANIDLTDYAATYGNIIIGAASNTKYSGTFDGNGCKLTVNLDGGANMAPFSYTNGATIKNLYVDGTIKASGKYAAGIVSDAYGSTTIEKCISDVIIESTVSGDGTHGGLVGVAAEATLTINNCAFIGEINGTGTDCCGGFIGWCTKAAVIKNSYMAGTFTVGTDGSNTFARSTHTLQNCYYLTAFGGVNASGATQKDADAFASGEVTYLLNGSTSDASVVWKQTIGTDDYPSFTGLIVAYDETADPQYYNTESDIVSVTVTWTAMEFTYTDGEWNPDTHNYDEGEWTSTGGTVTVENTGTVDVTVTFDYESTVTGVSGTFSNPTAELAPAEKKDSKLSLKGKPDKELSNEAIGTITVTVKAKETEEDAEE